MMMPWEETVRVDLALYRDRKPYPFLAAWHDIAQQRANERGADLKSAIKAMSWTPNSDTDIVDIEFTFWPRESWERCNHTGSDDFIVYAKTPVSEEKLSVADRLGTNPDRIHTENRGSLPRRRGVRK